MKIDNNPGAGGLKGRVTHELREQKILKHNLEKELARLKKMKKQDNSKSPKNLENSFLNKKSKEISPRIKLQQQCHFYEHRV